MIDDNGNKTEIPEDATFQISPKGFFMTTLLEYGATWNQAKDEWLKFEGFCVKQARDNAPDATFAALVFNGDGGVVIGAEKETT